MSTDKDTNAWRRVAGEEQAAMEPYILRCAGLSDAAVARVRREFRVAAIACVRTLAHRLGRVPAQGEFDLVREAVTRRFNEARIPELAEEEAAARLVGEVWPTPAVTYRHSRRPKRDV